MFLDEGTHRFTLENGALLTVYASPYTPKLGVWGFQYLRRQGHDFAIESGVDVVNTHGPPKGIMDGTYEGKRAGCPKLFAAVARARPRIHCFGHIHEDWGAKLVTWREALGQVPDHLSAIDNNRSVVIEKLKALKPSTFDSQEDSERKMKRLERYEHEKCCKTSHCAGDENPLWQGEQTIFVNAFFCSSEDMPVQRPWLVDIELPEGHQRDERVKG